MPNQTILQFFHWYASQDGQWWNYCAAEAKRIAQLGFTAVYLPPAYKSAWGKGEPGYAVYDLYDLGEFDQKGTVPTRYGTKEDYLRCIGELHNHKLAVIADIVMNHRLGGDEEETFKARIVHNDNRNEFASEEHEVTGYTRFKFPGRKEKYSAFEWDHRCFTGIGKHDNDQVTIYSILNEYGDKWEKLLEDEMGNYDFLMGADVEFRNESVREELIKWGTWYIETTNLDGFRLDAVKHITPSFIREWLHAMRSHFKKDFFCVSEYWRNDHTILLEYINATEGATQLFDVPLHYNFHIASKQGKDFDLSKLLEGTLLQHKPELTVTFVENHDTQPLQCLESVVDHWFKPLAYAVILLREQGIPVVFYPCLYGASYTDKKGDEEFNINMARVEELETLIKARRDLAYGLQIDYFDHPNVAGWVRQGVDNKKNSGLAVLISNSEDGFKEMDMGKANAGKTYHDLCGHVSEVLTTDEHGKCTFLVKGGSVSVWAIKTR